MCDLFGSLLEVTVKKRVDIREVLAYPLMPLPLSLCHVDGSLLHSPNTALLDHIKSKFGSSCKNVDTLFFMHLQVNFSGNLE